MYFYQILTLSGVYPIIPGATPYKGGSSQKGYLFSGFRYIKGLGFHQLTYMTGWGSLSFRSVKGPKRANRWNERGKKTFQFSDLFVLKDRAFNAVKRDAVF